MNLKKSSALFLAIALVLPMLLMGCEGDVEYYDTQFLTIKGWKWPPYIPGTEGQAEVKIQVLDATTMEPIEGALVVVGYYGLSGAGEGGSMACINSESAVSDENGWATFPNDQDPRVDRRLRGPEPVTAYKRGYQRVSQFYSTYSEIEKGQRKWSVYKSEPWPDGAPPPPKRATPVRTGLPDHKSALLETKERSTIYLMPSTAKTADERWSELSKMGGGGGGGCLFDLPLAFTKSEGGLAAMKAVYQEMQDIGYPEYVMKGQKELIESYGDSYQKLRSGYYEKLRRGIVPEQLQEGNQRKATK